jgi:hypothetical protein
VEISGDMNCSRRTATYRLANEYLWLRVIDITVLRGDMNMHWQAQHAATTAQLYRENLEQCLRYDLVRTECNDDVSTAEVRAIRVVAKRKDDHES